MKNTVNLLFLALAIVAISLYSCDPTNPEVAEASSIEILQGNNQTGLITQRLTNSIELIVKDQNGNAISNIEVNIKSENGKVEHNDELNLKTNSEGKISVVWMLGTEIGTQNLTVTAFKENGTTPLTNSPISISANAKIPDNVTDIEGNTYGVVKIGTKVWMKENLKVTKYADGTEIANVTDSYDWNNLNDNNSDKAYCFYDNNSNSEYGALYTLAAVTNGSTTDAATIDKQGVCPDGWHVSTGDEWQKLIDTLGGTLQAGGKLKEEGTLHWETPNNGATNSSGFTAFGGGYRESTGSFKELAKSGLWWNIKYYSLSEDADFISLYYGNEAIGNTLQIAKSSGMSVRCVMNYDVDY